MNRGKPLARTGGLKRRTRLRSKAPARDYPRVEKTPVRPVETTARAFVAADTAGEAVPKATVVKSSRLRASARGEACCLRIPGACDGGGETTILAHLPGPIAASKSTDLACSAYCCAPCHDRVDRRVIDLGFDAERDWFLRRAQTLTLARMLERGLIRVAGENS